MANTPHQTPALPVARSFLDRYGATILSGGVAAIPNALYLFQAQLGLSPQEVWFISYILVHRWEDEYPHPSLVRMEQRTGHGQRQLHRIKDSLIAKGYLRLVERFDARGGQAANGYDFTALFTRMAALIRE